MSPEELIALATQAMKKAYAPYSGFQVGTALLATNGQIYQGCNIENAAFSPTICAERVAFAKAVYDGVRDFAALAVVGGKGGVISGFFPPCGVCRQVMGEFCREDFPVYLGGPEGAWEMKTLSQLLPWGFSGKTHMQK